MQVGTAKFSHRNCAQIVPTVSVLPILSVLSLDRISNLVFSMDPMSSTPTLGSNKFRILFYFGSPISRDPINKAENPALPQC